MTIEIVESERDLRTKIELSTKKMKTMEVNSVQHVLYASIRRDIEKRLRNIKHENTNTSRQRISR